MANSDRELSQGQIKRLSEGPVARLTGKMRDKVIADSASLPHFDKVRTALNALGCEFVWSKMIYSGGSARNVHANGSAPDGVLYLLRLSGGIGNIFGIAREIPILMSRHEDIEGRLLVRAAVELANILDRTFDSSKIYCFVQTERYSRSLRLSESHQADAEAIWGSTEDQLKASFVDALIRTYRIIDLYDKKGPVVSEDFYGRERVLSGLERGLSLQEIHGVFGMRKTGKTSVLHELRRRYSAPLSSPERHSELFRGKIFVYFDLEKYDFNVEGQVEKMAQDLAGAVSRELARYGVSRRSIADFAQNCSSPTLSDFEKALSDTIFYRKNHELVLVLMLDEIEHFLLSDTGIESTTPNVNLFLRIVRNIVQESQSREEGGKLALLLAGLSPSVVESSDLNGKDNPLFELVQKSFLGPLDEVDSNRMLSRLGARMGMTWTSPALKRAFNATGGNVILLRKLGSLIASERDSASLEVLEVDESRVQRSSLRLPHAAKDYLEQALSHLERHYPDESAFIELVLETGGTIQSAAIGMNIDFHRFESLGLVQIDDQGDVHDSRVLELALAQRRSQKEFKAVDANARRASDLRQEVLEAIANGEDRRTEFKKSILIPLNKKDKPNEEALKRTKEGRSVRDELTAKCFRAIASFVNSDGGTLYIGICDDGRIVGVDECIKFCGSRDEFTLTVTDLLKEYSRDEFLHLLDIQLVEVEAHWVCVIKCRAGEVFSQDSNGKGDGIFVRDAASSRFLQGRDMFDYLRSRSE